MPNAQLEDWLAAESQLRQRQAAASHTAQAPHEALARMTGLELMQAQLRGELPPASIANTLDFMLIAAEHGHCVFQGAPGLGHLNPMGSVHGGWFATLLDSALGCAVHTALPLGKAYTTLELKVNLIRALSPKVVRVRAEGHVIHLGGQTATADARLVGPDGKLYAHGSTTCLVFDQRPAAPQSAA